MLTAGKPACLCRETRSPHVRPLPDGRGSDTEARNVNQAIRAATGVPPWGRERLLLRLTAVSRQKPAGRYFSPVLLCDVAQALLPAAPALVPALDTVSQRRIGVETSLDTAGTSACATSGVRNAG